MGGDLDMCLHLILSGLKRAGMGTREASPKGSARGVFDHQPPGREQLHLLLPQFICQTGKVTVPATQGCGKIRVNAYGA